MLDHLFSPIKINTCELPNRTIVPAMVTNFCNEDGTATEKYIRYHEEKAKGGWGLIITEDYRISEHCGGYQFVPGLWNDEQMEGHKKLTETVHRYSSKIFCQIYHAGRQTNEAVNGGVQPVAPSPIPCPLMGRMPKVLTAEEIQQIVSDFGDTALRAKKCGFDGVEIHGGHGYLIAEFLSAYSNKRTDEYGGCLYNRMRFIREIYADVRAKVGKDFPVTIRFSADEFVPGGNTVAEARVLAMEFEKMGFDGLNVSGSVYFNYETAISAPMSVPHAWLSSFAEEVKKLVKIPVLTVNRVNDPLIADSLIAAGKADVVAMGRASIADPHFPNKAKEGKFEDIRQCIGCLQGCTGGIHGGGEMRCLVNPEIGFEYLDCLKPAAQRKKVYIAGGGVAGMTAALSAAAKGHQVVLFEASEKLGGQFVSAAYPPTKGELASYVGWLIRELRINEIEVRMETSLTKEIIDAEKPDFVIAATGGKPILPRIKGIEGQHVFTAEDVLLGYVSCGQQIVVAGGGEVGAETAAMLGMQNKAVTLIEMTDKIAPEMHGRIRPVLLGLLDRYHVDVRVNTKLVEIKEDSILIERDGCVEELRAENVVLGLGYRPNSVLFDQLSPHCSNIVQIAGANETSNALRASREGFDAGCAIC